MTKTAINCEHSTMIKGGKNRALYSAAGSHTARENVGVMHVLTCGVNVNRLSKGRQPTKQES